MFNTRPLFAFARDAEECGQRVVLVTLYAVEGTSSRNPGAHLVVREDGQYAGSLSDGCVEGAIARTALEVLVGGGSRELRLGRGSAFIDIRLPCGGAIDLMFNELPSGIAACILGRIEAREPFRLSLPRGDGQVELLPDAERFGLALSESHAFVSHVPPLRMAVMGHGPTISRLARLASTLDVEIQLVTQDERLAGDLRAQGFEPVVLKGVGSIPDLHLDRWTACTLFFHDHEWEPPLIGLMLKSDAFFIGAMGSRKTHEERRARLGQAGFAAEDIERIAAPIGLIPSLRDPETLAVSTLAQVIDAYNRAWL
jgi:xanthine dehydrogenase accessory factor